MLIVRREQMEVLGQAMMRNFEDRMVAHLRSRFPNPTRDQRDEELRAVVRRGVQSGNYHGITLEGDLRRYLEYWVSYGEEFGSNPSTNWAAAILRAEGVSGTAKMDRIDNYDLFVSRGQP